MNSFRESISAFFRRFSKPKSDLLQLEYQEPRMYLILREDLSMKYLQGTHAVCQFALDHPEEFQRWGNQTVIALSVFNGLTLQRLSAELAVEVAADKMQDNLNWSMSVFFEPDLESPLPTAIAIFENGNGIVAKRLKYLNMATK